ncbi:serine/threonine-protein kinase [Spirosoma lituiforme]
MPQTFTSFKDFKQRYPIRPNDDGALLGSGSYGRVIKVEDQLETEWVAVKISEFKGNDTKSLKAEVELAQRVPRQANIARYDACYRLETDTSVSDFAIMKYYPDGNLVDLFQRVALTPAQIYDITQGILLGLQHLHRNRIVHRDFKPANILISRDNAGRFIPKIADFGLSKLVSDDELDSSDFDLSDGRGTPSYKAPEQIEGSRVSFNLDLWAFGVILYEMMTGEKPFRSDLRNSSEQSVRREIEKKIMTVELPDRLNQVVEPYRTIIRRCLVRDIHERARKEQELLDLLDAIPQLIAEAKELVNRQEYKLAIALYEQVLAKREAHPEAQQGLEQCELGLQRQHQANLLKEADDLMYQRLFAQAKDLYEQVLQLNPVEETAMRGLALCIEALRPKTQVPEPELTDVYQEERTDVYVPTPEPVAKPARPVAVQEAKPKREPVRETKPVSVPLKKAPVNPVSQPPVLPPVNQSILVDPVGRSFPWRVVAPIALVVGGLVLYMNLPGNNPVTQVPTGKPESTSMATVGPTIRLTPTPEKGSKEIKRVAGESESEMETRIDVALKKAQRFYQQKDYMGVITMTNSALKLDPSRRDVVALRAAALKAVKEIPEKTSEEKKAEAPVTGTTEAPKGTESDKPKPVEPVAESPKNAKAEAQDKYDQLIENGQKAIAKGNNKAKAITDFAEARALAKEHDLTTSKAEAAYTTYMATANRIFDRDEFEGAKDWYQVAKSLKDTEEVRRKIKLCNNQ